MRARVGDLGALALKVPGRHNVQNALAAVAVGLEVGVPFQQIAAALGQFSGAERRFQKLGEAGGVLVIDDYGHHPTEIAAVIAAAPRRQRAAAAGSSWSFSRTGTRGRGISSMRSARRSRGADEIVLTDIYAAGEAPLPGITLDTFAAQVRRDVKAPVHVDPEISTMYRTPS